MPCRLAIDQADRSIVMPGRDPETCRVGYVDPYAVYIDATRPARWRSEPGVGPSVRRVSSRLSAVLQMHAVSGPTPPAIRSGRRRADGLTNELRRIPVAPAFEPEFSGVLTIQPVRIISPMMRGLRDAIALMWRRIDTAANSVHGGTSGWSWGFPRRLSRDGASLLRHAGPPHATQENWWAISDDTSCWRDPVKSQRAGDRVHGFLPQELPRRVDLEAQQGPWNAAPKVNSARTLAVPSNMPPNSPTAIARSPEPTLAKVVATLGPASDSPETIGRLIDAGVDVFRLNFSHGTFAEHERRLHSVRRAAAERERPIAVLGDLQGPKIRLGHVPR